MKGSEKMEMKRLHHSDLTEFRKLIEIFNEVFENDGEIPHDQHLSTLLSNPDFMVFVVIIDNNVVGGLTIYVLHRYYGTKPLAYIYDLGIAPAFQGKGMGKALIAEVCRFCKVSGFEEVYVEAEDEDLDAVNFYRKTAYSHEMVTRHFTYTLTDEPQ
jgi:aminoglycoside 3-N-acetyltransferase I